MADLPCVQTSGGSIDDSRKGENLTLNNGHKVFVGFSSYYNDFTFASGKTSSRSYYLNGAYTLLTGVYGQSINHTYYMRPGHCDIYCDDVLVWSQDGPPDYAGNGLPVEFSLDVTGCQVLRLDYSDNTGEILADLRVHPAPAGSAAVEPDADSTPAEPDADSAPAA